VAEIHTLDSVVLTRPAANTHYVLKMNVTSKHKNKCYISTNEVNGV